ncbi:MAG: LamG-like jellyroll fold domain-containing protein [Planctomycetota bacterium]|jgi:hypothetical protein
MRLQRLELTCLLAFAWTLSLEGAESRLCEPWDSQYAGDDLSGGHVIALWQFTAGAELEDASGNGHVLTLHDASIHADGRFGGCLESFPGWPVNDKRHRAAAKSHADLSPAGPFTLELYVKPKPELGSDYPDAFLLDKKYVAHHDYQLILGRPDRNGSRVLRACLGFGEDSSTWHSRPVRLEPDAWYHVAFTYDGAGTGSFFLDGVPWGSSKVDARKGISPGRHLLSIGDRIGSYYHGFPGYLDQVRISRGALEFRRAKFELASDRACFLRMEPDASLRFAVTNLQRGPLTGGIVSLALPSATEKKVAVPRLGPAETLTIDYPLNTRLRPDEYRLTARLAVEDPAPYESEESFAVRIVPRQPPHQFPVLMWGVYGSVTKEIERLERIGFTHVLGLGADTARIFEAKSPTEAADPEKVAQAKQMLDEALARGIRVAASLSPGAAMRSREALRRIDRNGKPYSRDDVCGLFPELQELCHNVGASVVQTYGHFPAFEAAMIHTEVRDHANPCFHDHDRAAFRKAAGFDVPPEIAGRRGVDYTKLADFPTDRVIPDDHPIYLYYRWYWKTGDGWNGLNTALCQGLKSTGRDLWTYHDPAVRVAGVYGSGGEVDFLSQWTYSYPDPIRIGLATDELLAMAAGGPAGQQVMKMTQIIWYRSQTAPQPSKPADRLPYQARWEREQPAAPFITIPPMHLREAFWTKIARPIRGVMYHGWQSLVPCEPPGSYRFTHPETQHELARLIRQVVRPLGPTLLQVPGVRSDVAFLESFASEMFARRGTYGWGTSWAADAYHAVLYAHLQPEIVFDETVLERGLDGYQVLVMADCDVLTQSVAERARAFQARGGLIVGDERLAPALEPDVRLPVYQRAGRADQDKAALESLAAKLRQKLDARYARYVDSSDPNVIPYRRRYKQADYVFVVNDRREFGRYVGHHGKVMENGLPSKAVVSIGRQDGFVYDLVDRRQVPVRKDDGRLLVDVLLGPCDGRVYLISPRPIQQVALEVPDAADLGQPVTCRIEVVDGEGRPLEAVVPVELDVRDPEGKRAERSGYYGASDGKLEVTLDVAPNDPPGIWQVEARELASGRTSVGYFRVRGPEPWPPIAKPDE